MIVLRVGTLTLTAALVALTLTGCAFGTSGQELTSKAQTPAARQDTEDQTPSAKPGDNVNPLSGPIGDHQSVVDEACGPNPAGTDMGPRYGANGTVTASDPDGRATIYTVAGGDSYKAIVERFCLDSRAFATINFITNIGQITQGEVYAFTEAAAVDARRAEGLDFAACPRTQQGYPMLASINWASLPNFHAEATDIGRPIDTGAAGTAQGEVRTGPDGTLLDYTVASGDTWRGVEDRFCMDTYYVSSLTGLFGQYPMIHPGDVIPLQPRHREIAVR